MILSGNQALDPVGLAPTLYYRQTTKSYGLSLKKLRLARRPSFNYRLRSRIILPFTFPEADRLPPEPRPRIERLDAPKAQTVDGLGGRI